LLLGLNGNVIPIPEWKGGFNLTHMGPGPIQVHVNVTVTFNVTSIWNVVGTILGAIEPDRMIILGSHRDAWTFGSVDPISSHSSIMETARVLGKLMSAGWQPRRTIKFCSWDAEEYGLIGSFEFTEKWKNQLATGAVIYLNLYTAVTGGDFFSVGGTPALQKKIIEISQTIYFPNTNKTLYSVWNPAKISFLGSGSDYTSFIQRLGIPSLDFTLASFNDSYFSTVYHSIYDSYYWANNFGDPQFEFHYTMVSFYGTLVLQLSDSEILPFDYGDYYTLIMEKIAALKASNGTLNCTSLDNAAAIFLTATELVQVEISSVSGKSDLAKRFLNDRLMLTERAFLGDSFTSGSKYFLHVISAPSEFNSYASNAFPAIYDALYQGDLQTAQFLVERIAQLVEGAANFLAFTN